jgi:hypothetical protein
MVDARLTDVILTVCRHVPKLKDRHVYPGGALGDFAVKIDLAYMLKIITVEAYKDLMIIKDIRNRFAHRTDLLDFHSQYPRDKSNSLKLIETHVGELKWEKGASVIQFRTTDRPRIFVTGHKHRLKDPRERYLTTAQLFMVCLAPATCPITQCR